MKKCRYQKYGKWHYLRQCNEGKDARGIAETGGWKFCPFCGKPIFWKKENAL